MILESYYLAFFLFLMIASLYSAVGHAGASGYLAIMALLSFSPEVIKPTSLILNCIVALIASVSYIKRGYFNRKVFLSFVGSSLPFAFLGGKLSLNPLYFKLVTGLFLIVSAGLLILKNVYKYKEETKSKELPLLLALLIGAIIGLISGLIGVGGGIFLSPILILAGWTSIKEASGVSALFILVNSVSGLMGHFSALNQLHTHILYWAVAVILGGLIGSYLGTKRLNNNLILTFLSIVLIVAGLKFILVK